MQQQESEGKEYLLVSFDQVQDILVCTERTRRGVAYRPSCPHRCLTDHAAIVMALQEAAGNGELCTIVLQNGWVFLTFARFADAARFCDGSRGRHLAALRWEGCLFGPATGLPAIAVAPDQPARTFACRIL